MSHFFEPSYRPLGFTDASSDSDDHEKLITKEVPIERGSKDPKWFMICLFFIVTAMISASFSVGFFPRKLLDAIVQPISLRYPV